MDKKISDLIGENAVLKNEVTKPYSFIMIGGKKISKPLIT